MKQIADSLKQMNGVDPKVALDIGQQVFDVFDRHDDKAIGLASFGAVVMKVGAIMAIHEVGQEATAKMLEHVAKRTRIGQLTAKSADEDETEIKAALIEMHIELGAAGHREWRLKDVNEYLAACGAGPLTHETYQRLMPSFAEVEAAKRDRRNPLAAG